LNQRLDPIEGHKAWVVDENIAVVLVVVQAVRMHDLRGTHEILFVFVFGAVALIDLFGMDVSGGPALDAVGEAPTVGIQIVFNLVLVVIVGTLARLVCYVGTWRVGGRMVSKVLVDCGPRKVCEIFFVIDG